MQVRLDNTHQIIHIDPNAVVGRGGEATIYSISSMPSAVAKIYHQPTPEHTKKLRIMIANPPGSGVSRVSIAWPSQLLVEPQSSEVVGFIMPRVSNMRGIMDIYNPRSRRRHSPTFNYRYLHRAAHNLAAAVRVLHERSYVIGDVNESNVLVGTDALITLVDTDSFQVTDPNQRTIFRCRVGKPEFTPPELQGQTLAGVTRTQAHDLFGLGVLIFQLLMEGIHPFNGIFHGAGDAPPLGDRIAAGHFPYGAQSSGLVAPAKVAPPFELLHPEVRKLFLQCFESGHLNPGIRPEAETWQNALTEAEKSLIVCNANDQHHFGSHLNICPWCARSRKFRGHDPFPPTKKPPKQPQAPSPSPYKRTTPPVCPVQIATPQVASQPVKCGNCGSVNAKDEVFCQTCGHQLVANTSCPRCGFLVPATGLFCSRCGGRR